MYLLNLIVILILTRAGFANDYDFRTFFHIGSTHLVENVKAEGYNAIQELNNLSSNNNRKFESHLSSELLNANNKVEKLPNILLKSELKEEKIIPENVSKCKDIYASELQALLKKSKNDNKVCLSIAQNDIRTLNNQLKTYTDNIAREVQTLSEIYNKCVKFLRPISTSSCIIRHTISIQRSIRSILSNGRIVASEGGNKFLDILDVTRKCINTNIKSAKKDLQVIIKKIALCVLNGELTTTKPTVSTKTTKIPTKIPTTVTVPDTTKQDTTTIDTTIKVETTTLK